MSYVLLENPADMTGLTRLDLLDLDQLHEAVQGYLQDLTVAVEQADSDIPSSQPGRNRGKSWVLFSYRTFAPPGGAAIDPVVVGVTVIMVAEDQFRVTGDIVGEGRGDILFERPPREVIGMLALLEACRDAAAALSCQAQAVVTGLRDARREA